MADLSLDETKEIVLVDGAGVNEATVLSNGALKTDAASVNGTTISVNAGTADAGSQRVVLASDQFVPVYFAPGSLSNGAETAVAASAVQVIASNASRTKLIIQNTGLANVRVGITGVTTTTGFRLTPGSMVIFDSPNCPTNAIFAIREGAVSSTVLAQQAS